MVLDSRRVEKLFLRLAIFTSPNIKTQVKFPCSKVKTKSFESKISLFKYQITNPSEVKFPCSNIKDTNLSKVKFPCSNIKTKSTKSKISCSNIKTRILRKSNFLVQISNPKSVKSKIFLLKDQNTNRS